MLSQVAFKNRIDIQFKSLLFCILWKTNVEISNNLEKYGSLRTKTCNIVKKFKLNVKCKNIV